MGVRVCIYSSMCIYNIIIDICIDMVVFWKAPGCLCRFASRFSVPPEIIMSFFFACAGFRKRASSSDVICSFKNGSPGHTALRVLEISESCAKSRSQFVKSFRRDPIPSGQTPNTVPWLACWPKAPDVGSDDIPTTLPIW